MQKQISLLVGVFSTVIMYGQGYNIKDFGAVTDSTKLNTIFIQAAIDQYN